jgi:pyruvate kinase
VSDVATAVYEGADAVMLSAESASGAWPDKSVEMMDKIACSVERDSLYRSIITAQRNDPEPTAADAISHASRDVAETLKLAAMVCYTSSGSTALRVSRERPNVPIIVLSPNTATIRRLSLVWGVTALSAPWFNENASVLERFRESVRDILPSGSTVVMTAGWPFARPGTTNLVHVATV